MPASGTYRIGHPSGVMEASARVEIGSGGEPVIVETSFIRTARRIFDGTLYVESSRLPWLNAQPPSA